jgi:TrwC relaxase
LAIGALYDLALRHELAARGLALRWTIGPTGLADVVGVPRSAIEATSFRHAQVTADLADEAARAARAGADPGTAGHRRSHFASTRTRFVAPATDWRTRSAEAGFGPAQASMLFPPLRVPDHGPAHLDHEAAAEAQTWLAAQGSTWSRVDAMRALAATSQGGATPVTVSRLVDELCQQSVSAGHDRWTTPGARAHDLAVLEAAGPRSVPRAAVPDGVAAAVLADRMRRPPEAGAAAHALVSGGAVEVLSGQAGQDRFVEQAAALDAARAIWQAAGVRVAVDAPASEVPRWTALTALGSPEPDHPPAVLVVDRADRRTSADLAELLHSAAATQTRVILVSGGTLPARRRPVSAAIDQLVHQTLSLPPLGPDLDRSRPATLSGTPGAARSGRVVAVPSAGDALAAVVDRWEALPAGERPLMIGLGPPEVEALNGAARDRLRAAGLLGPDEVAMGGRLFAVGDRIISRHSGPGALGSTGTVTRVSADPPALTVRWDVAERLDREGRPEAALAPAQEPAAPREPVVSGWDAKRLVHGYATTPKLAARIVDPARLSGSTELPSPTVILGDPRQVGRLADREILAVVVAPMERIGPRPIDRLSRLAAAAMSSPAPHRVTRPIPAEAPLAELAHRHEYLDARLRASLPSDPEPGRRRLDDDRAWYNRRPGGPTVAETRQLAIGTAQLSRGDAAVDTWIGAHRADLQEWAELGRAMDRRAALVAHAATVDPEGTVRDLVGPEPTRPAERALWRRAVKEVAVHADRWPRSANRLEANAPVAEVTSHHRKQWALHDLERSLGRGAVARSTARKVERDTGLGL